MAKILFQPCCLQRTTKFWMFLPGSRIARNAGMRTPRMAEDHTSAVSGHFGRAYCAQNTRPGYSLDGLESNSVRSEMAGRRFGKRTRHGPRLHTCATIRRYDHLSPASMQQPFWSRPADGILLAL